MKQVKLKYTKIIILITVLISSLLALTIYSLAYDINSFMEIFGKKVGSFEYSQESNNYLTGTEEEKKEYLAKSVGFPELSNGSDYWAVRKYPQVWCMSEGQVNSAINDYLRVYGIIEIGENDDPTESKLYYINSNGNAVIQRGIEGLGSKRRAQAAYTMMVGTNTNITGVAQKHFYDTFKSALSNKTYLKKFYDDETRGDTKLDIKYGSDSNYTFSEYANDINEIQKPVDTENFTNIVCINKETTCNLFEDKVNTVIRDEPNNSYGKKVYNFNEGNPLVTDRIMTLTTSDNKKVTYKIKQGKTDNGTSCWYLYSNNTIKGGIGYTSNKIYLKDKLEVTKVKIEIKYNYIHGILYMIGGRDTQTRAVSKGEWLEGTMSNTLNIAITQKDVDVSMQKYITKVNGVSLGKDEKNANLRANTKTIKETVNADGTKSADSDKRIYENGRYKEAAKPQGNEAVDKYEVKEYYKRENPVDIGLGDEVSYRISIYNNSDVDAENVRIEDRIPYIYQEVSENNGITTYNILSAAEVTSVKLGTKDITGDIENKNESKADTSTKKYNGSLKRIVYTIPKLSGNSSVYLEVTLAFNMQLPNDSVVTNTAFLYADNNKSEYRRLDRDYVKMVGVDYKVSLEKFISKLNDQDITGRTGINEKEAQDIYRFSEFATSNDGIRTLNANTNILNNAKSEVPNLHFKKYNEAVGVEAGDKVTYTIRLRNTGESPVKITKIYDCFRYVEKGDYIGVKLEYDSMQCSNSNVIATIIDNHYRESKEEEWIREEGNYDYILDRYLIEFSSEDENNLLLKNKGDYLDLYITYSVDIPKEMTNQELILQNKASILSLENEKGFSVTDGDGDDNNEDMDFIKTKKYAVSLEKYVSQVNGKSLEDVNSGPVSQRPGKAEYLTAGTYVDNTSNDTEWKRNNTYKYDNCVTVSNGDKVTYTIKVRNDGNSTDYGDICFTQITDYLPDGVIYKGITYDGTQYDTQTDNANVLTNLSDVLVKPEQSAELTVEAEVIEPNLSLNILKNVAEITEIKNRNGIVISDTTPYNNKDADYIILNNDSQTIDYTVRKSWSDSNNPNRPNSVEVQLYRNNEKYREKVTLDNSNNWTYTWLNTLPKYDINGNEYIYSVKEENVPDGYNVRYNSTSNNTEIINTTNQLNRNQLTSRTVKKVWIGADGKEFIPSEGSITVQLYRNNESYGNKVTLDNSNNWTYTWENTLTKFDSNENEYIYTIKEITVTEGYKTTYSYDDYNKTFIITNIDKSVDSNLDIISGYVWNDKELNKEQDGYNGSYDSSENPMEGIKVILYRIIEDNTGRETYKAVAETITDDKGYYAFNDNDLSDTVGLNKNEKYIKGEKNIDNNRWSGKFYSYYVVFEYDGITYTSTFKKLNGEVKRIWEISENDIKSNACEDNNQEENTTKKEAMKLESRSEFNARFSSINNTSVIKYETKNEKDFIPQSNHIYDSEIMSIRSSTDRIDLSNNANVDRKIKNINLGLIDKDVFDLELTSDVDNIAVKINNIIGVYKYSNKVTLRKENLNSNIYVDSYDQNIRKLDDEKLNEIIVTYKVTIANTSPTVGTATKITNYYDDKYEFIEAADSQGNTLPDIAGEAGDGYNSRIITTSATPLKNGEKMEIYLVYRLDLSNGALNGLDINNPIPTYNITEITEYKTFDGESDKYTRGLIDKDSAPGSINKEQVRLTTTEGQKTPTTGGNPTTVKYYFESKLEDNKKDPDYLRRFKYEDDTYATPTIYFVKTNDTRIITGTVFEDITKVQPNTRIKTGNGKLDEGEVGVFGVKVELIEQGGSGSIYETSSDEYGKFEFRDFLPGNYIIRYTYGHNTQTVLLNQKQTGINAKSYNGEDFQATNNYADVDGMETNKLNTTENYWYVFNETYGISTGFDDNDRRTAVSTAATEFTDERMTVLNNMRKGRAADEAAVGTDPNKVTVQNIIDATYMFAETKKMLLELEEPEKVIKKDEDSGNTIQVVESSNRYKSEYKIDNMNFGIAEVPVTIVDLQKHVDSFIITDVSGKNTIASMHKDAENKWVIKGDVLPDLNDKVDVSIENEKLQGARLEVTYEISLDLNKEVNFDGTENVVPTITGIVDFVNNNLSYNSSLGNNEAYWEVTTYDNIKALFAAQKWNSGTEPQGVVNPDGKAYATIVKAKDDNPLLNTTSGKGTATITLERVLSSTDLTLDQIITSTVDTFEYANIVEITGFNYGNNPGETVYRDRVRNTEKFVILPGVQYDYATSETIAIHPPTGTNAIDIMYYIVAVIALGILAVGVYGIKKFVVKK